MTEECDHQSEKYQQQEQYNRQFVIFITMVALVAMMIGSICGPILLPADQPLWVIALSNATVIFVGLLVVLVLVGVVMVKWNERKG